MWGKKELGEECGVLENSTCLTPTPFLPIVFEDIWPSDLIEKQANCKQYMYVAVIFSAKNIFQAVKMMSLFLNVLLIADFHHYRNHYKCKISKGVASRNAKGCK